MRIDIVNALADGIVKAAGDYGIRLVRGSPDERVPRRILKRPVEEVANQVDSGLRQALRPLPDQRFPNLPDQ